MPMMKYLPIMPPTPLTSLLVCPWARSIAMAENLFIVRLMVQCPLPSNSTRTEDGRDSKSSDEHGKPPSIVVVVDGKENPNQSLKGLHE